MACCQAAARVRPATSVPTPQATATVPRVRTATLPTLLFAGRRGMTWEATGGRGAVQDSGNQSVNPLHAPTCPECAPVGQILAPRGHPLPQYGSSDQEVCCGDV